MTMANTESRGSQADNAGQQSLPREDRGGGGSAREQIREVKNQVVDRAKNTFQQARDRAGSSLGESKGQLAEQFGTMADALRRTTEHLRSEDQQRIAGLTDTVSRQVEQVAEYLRNKDAAAMRRDLENLARRQPALMLGGALVLGLIGARFLKSSERSRAGRRYGDGRSSGRDRHVGYTGYDQPFTGQAGMGGETELERHIPGGSGFGRSGGLGEAEGGTGGGYAGA